MNLLIGMYLSAIVIANVTVALFGPAVAIVNAFLFIGLDLTAGDRLHDAWHGRGLVWKSAALIASGSVLSYALALLLPSSLPADRVAQVAAASFVAFAASAAADRLVYALLLDRAFLVRSNGSNVVSAAVDSAVFPTLAFGAVLPAIVIGQFAAKVLGGMIWSVVLRPRRERADAA